jgi:glycosyltransferase involved in cell wall biosynthesis
MMTISNIAIYTYDIHEHNAHLMPWRTVIEVARSLSDQGLKTHVISNSKKQAQVTINDVQVNKLPKPVNTQSINALAAFCEKKQIQAIYFPLAWKLSLQLHQELARSLKAKIIWYIPGAWYSFKQAIKSIRHLGLKASMPFLYQSIVPRKRFVKQLLKIGDSPIITMTDYNRNKLIDSGCPGNIVFSIPPGKASLPKERGSDRPVFDGIFKKLNNRPYFLFFGPPQAIRGINQILEAFKRVAQKNEHLCLVCLFRSDKDLHVERLKNTIDNSGMDGRLFCVWESVAGQELDLFLEHCYGVLKPFLLVPSEIPLAIIETAGYGKPVIGTGPDGTGCFIEQFGLMVPPADSAALAEAMLELRTNKDLYDLKCQRAKEIYDSHPDWNHVALQWLKVAQTTDKVT